MKFSAKLVGLAVVTLVLFRAPMLCERPAKVNIGAIFTFNSVIGRAAKLAMEMAVPDINADLTILNGTELEMIMEDTGCSVFMGSIKAFQLIEKEIVSIIGPQSSAIAHVISHIANGFHIPLVSFAATDPSLAALQFPSFLRATDTDSNQMAAISDIIGFHGWKEIIAIFIDDEYGRNGINALGNVLAKKTSKISYKLPLPCQYNVSDIVDVLNKSRSLSTRVFVVHIDHDPDLKFFRIVEKLNMMSGEYVWFATDWPSSTLDSVSGNVDSLKILRGIVTLHPYIPETIKTKAFKTHWRKMRDQNFLHSDLNMYGLYAYDIVWLVARSIDQYLKKYGNLKFSLSDKLQLENITVLDGGEFLLKILSEANFTGLTGNVRFDSDRNLVNNGYSVINIVENELKNVGYWSNDTGLSVLSPESIRKNRTNSSRHEQKLCKIIWPGGSAEKPRGWVIATNEKPLRIGFPKRASFTEFVTELNYSHKVEGYCIDLFHEAVKLVPYDVPFRFVPFGNGLSNPNYDELVRKVAEQVFDAAIGDIAIVTNRTRIVDFTQPFVATGLVILAPLNESKSNTWFFLKSFTPQMWSITAASFVILAFVIWILEHRVNDHFRGPPKRQLITMFMFSFSTLFKANQESMLSTLGRLVMVVWLFLLLVITSSYTANLTSILTIEQLDTSITGINSLIASGLPIGYQVGSFSYSYMKDSLYIPRSRLVSLGSPEEYESALRKGPENGGVAAVVDELPYVELFLSKHKDFGIIGQSFTKSGWGFAFRKDSPLAIDMSTAILRIAENGKLQEVHKKWFCKPDCPEERTQKSGPNRLHLYSFWALYFLCGVFALSALLLFLLRAVRQYIRYKRQHMDPSSPASSITASKAGCLHVIYNFLDFVDKKEESIKKMFTQHEKSQSQITQ